MKVSSVIKYLLSLGVAGVLFYYAFQQVSLEDFLEKSKEVNYNWIWLSMALALISHWLRAYRWNLMLKPLGYSSLSDGRTFLAVMTGYLANLAFPRLGEVTRCGVMKRNEQMPMSVLLGSVITERVIDLFILIFLVVLDFVVEFDIVFSFFMKTISSGMVLLGVNPAQDYTVFLIFGSVIVVVGGVLFVYGLKKILGRNFENPFLQKIHHIITGIVDGLLSVRKIKYAFGFMWSTVGIWITYFLMSYFVFYALDETSMLGLGAGLSILAGAGVAMAIPVQGGIGTYHTFISGILMIYGISATSSLFFATLLHTSQVIMVIVVGSISIIITAIIAKKNRTIGIASS